MSLHTNLQGRLRNTNLPKSHGLLPVLETVVNSIHALEERGNLATTGQIVLGIQRDSQTTLEMDAESHPKDIESFFVEDNGIGFNDANMKSFETLDSDHKIEKGCRGIGRLLWLKAFNNVEISSSFVDSSGEHKFRSITFDAQNGIKLQEEEKILFGINIPVINIYL